MSLPPTMLLVALGVGKCMYVCMYVGKCVYVLGLPLVLRLSSVFRLWSLVLKLWSLVLRMWSCSVNMVPVSLVVGKFLCIHFGKCR